MITYYVKKSMGLITRLDDNYKDVMDEAKSKISQLSKKYDMYKDLCSNDFIIKSLFSKITKYNNDCVAIYEIGGHPFKNPQDKIDNTLKLKNKLTDNLILYTTMIKVNQEKINNYKQPPSSTCFSKDCPFLTTSKDIFTLQTEVEELNVKFKDTEKELNDIDIALENLKLSLKLMEMSEEFKSFLNDIPENIIKFIGGQDYSMTKVEELMEGCNVVTSYNNYVNTFEVLSKKENDLELIDSIDAKILSLSTELNAKKKFNEINKNTLNELDVALSKKYDMINKFEEYIELKNMSESFDIIKAKAVEYLDKEKEYHKALSDIEAINYDMQLLEANKIDKNNALNNINFSLMNIKQNRRQKEILDKYYADNQKVLDAISTKKGIPMVLVNTYLQTTRTLANQFIREIFNDNELQIGELVVTPKEFKIPLVGNGDGVKDISKASGGEKAIGAIALSLAIYAQNKTKYNILNMDEADGALDEDKRRNFIKTIKNYMEEHDIDQFNIITHNNFFNDIKANLVLFRGAKVDNYIDKEIVFKY